MTPPVGIECEEVSLDEYAALDAAISAAEAAYDGSASSRALDSLPTVKQRVFSTIATSHTLKENDAVVSCQVIMELPHNAF